MVPPCTVVVKLCSLKDDLHHVISYTYLDTYNTSLSRHYIVGDMGIGLRYAPFQVSHHLHVISCKKVHRWLLCTFYVQEASTRALLYTMYMAHSTVFLLHVPKYPMISISTKGPFAHTFFPAPTTCTQPNDSKCHQCEAQLSLSNASVFTLVANAHHTKEVTVSEVNRFG